MANNKNSKDSFNKNNNINKFENYWDASFNPRPDIEFFSEEQWVNYEYSKYEDNFVFDYQDSFGNIIMNKFDEDQLKTQKFVDLLEGRCYIVDMIAIDKEGVVRHI